MEHTETTTSENNSKLPSVEPFRDDVVGHGGPGQTYDEAAPETGSDDVEGHRVFPGVDDEAEDDVEGHRVFPEALGQRDAREDRQ